MWLKFLAAIVLTAALIVALRWGAGRQPETAAQGTDAAATAIERVAEKGPVKLTVRLSPTAPRLSDLLTLEVKVEAAHGVELKPLQFGRGVGDFLIRDYTKKTLPAGESGYAEQFIYKLEPQGSGKALIRAIPIEFIDNRADAESRGQLAALESEPLEVTVSSEWGEGPPNLADASPMQAPLLLPPKPIWVWVAGGVAAVSLLAGLYFWTRRRKQVQIAERRRTAEEIASEELNRLLAENLHGRGDHKEFYVRLTAIVRRYIEATTGIRAPEETTEEFLREMRARQIFAPERSTQLAQFLEAADMVKYAAQQPRERQVAESIGRAQEFVGLPSALKSGEGQMVNA